MNAWRVCQTRKLTLVVEADFVPCQGFADFPLPFSETMSTCAWGWLYSCGPTIYEMIEMDRCIYARGHSAAPVATLVCAEAARLLIEFAEKELTERNPNNYSYWDTYARMYLQRRGVNSYIAFRNYGEHGGIPNPEHKHAGLTANTHRADVLMSPLHFLPDYAKGSKFAFIKTRCYAKARGWGRLFFMRILEKNTLMTVSLRQRYEFVKFAVSRLISLY
ncbi:hypothetical protein SAMN05421783_1642 [Thiocapsa roseopersicina]|uniref:Uncharacterized protein n=1 Tax=Thiocapsa roseopersicina TaxID=1058 RepID=A0A1H3DW16_THIRO|nr:hypothetical protein SAMN05421783_1642 [Thiocapsa roseopersicina]